MVLCAILLPLPLQYVYRASPSVGVLVVGSGGVVLRNSLGTWTLHAVGGAAAPTLLFAAVSSSGVVTVGGVGR